MTGLTATAIKVEEAAKLYNMVRKSQLQEIDHEVQTKAWLNAADSVRPTEQLDQPAIHYSQTAARASTLLELELQCLSRAIYCIN